MGGKVINLNGWVNAHSKPIWLLDSNTAKYMAYMADKVEVIHVWGLEECPVCKGQFLRELGHNCNDTIEVLCDRIVEEK